MTAARIGTLKKPKQDCRKSYRPDGAKLTTGAMQMEMIASTMPKRLPMRTRYASEAFGLNSGRCRSSVYRVMQELSAELNDERIAPNRTAAKKPSSGFGIMVIISVGYARSEVFSRAAT